MAPPQANGKPPTSGVIVPVVNGHSTYAEKHNVPAHFIGGNHLAAAASSPVKEFVASHDGHTVITSVGLRSTWGRAKKFRLLTDVGRFSLPITESQLSRKSDQSENGLTRPLETSGPYSLLLWLRRRTCKQMQTTFEWQTNMWR